MKKQKKFSVVYLHIGLEKTGTTSIQEFLEVNRPQLKSDGFFVPGSLGHKNHKLLAAYGMEPGSRDIAVVSSGIGSTESEINDFRRRLEISLDREIQNSTADVAIISSEDLSRLFTSSEVLRIITLLGIYSETIKVIVFMRRQDLLASSRYYSLVIGGSKNQNVFPDVSNNPVKYYNYQRNIGLWIDAVGVENIIPVRFPESPKKEQFNSTDRFGEIIGIDPHRYEKISDQHVSYDAVNQIIIQNYNALKDSYDPVGLEKLMARLSSYNNRTFAHIPSAKQAQNFYNYFRSGNISLFRQLGAEREMFTDDFSMYPDDNMRLKYQQIAIQRLLRIIG